jgi:hypothetical protein
MGCIGDLNSADMRAVLVAVGETLSEMEVPTGKPE